MIIPVLVDNKPIGLAYRRHVVKLVDLTLVYIDLATFNKYIVKDLKQLGYKNVNYSKNLDNILKAIK